MLGAGSVLLLHSSPSVQTRVPQGLPQAGTCSTKHWRRRREGPCSAVQQVGGLRVRHSVMPSEAFYPGPPNSARASLFPRTLLASTSLLGCPAHSSTDQASHTPLPGALPLLDEQSWSSLS